MEHNNCFIEVSEYKLITYAPKDYFLTIKVL